MIGFLPIDKDQGITSHDVVARARKITGIRKIGHAGTLDPMATGLVVLGVGRATRLLRFVQDLPKVYEATVQFGVATDSLDADGAEVHRSPMPFDRQRLADVIATFVGEIQQVPPMVSALKHEGRRLHELAREGIEVDRPARPVQIHDLDLLDFEPGEFPVARIRVRCGSGTYVRSLADDIARALGGRAHLTALRRLANGSLHVDEAVTLEGLAAAEDWARFLLSPADGLRDMPAWDLTDEQAASVRHGRPLAVDAGQHGSVRMMHDGGLLAIYRVEGGTGKPEVVLG